MIVAIEGGLGSGKTCLLTKYAVESYLLQGRKVYSNYHLKRIPYTKLDIVDIYLNQPELKNVFIAGDELHTFMDCRLSQKRRNIIESYFVLQTRKKNVDLYFTSQWLNLVDIRLIRFVDVVIRMHKIYITNEDGIKMVHPYLFLAEFHDYREDFIPDVYTKIFDGRKWFDHYDTNEVIYPPDDYLRTEKEIKEKERTKNGKKKKIRKEDKLQE